MIKPEGRGFNSHPAQSFPLCLCGPSSLRRANAHMVYGLKHQHLTSHSITLFEVGHSLLTDEVGRQVFFQLRVNGSRPKVDRHTMILIAEGFYLCYCYSM